MQLKISKFNDYKIFKNARIGFEFEFYSKVGYYKLLELLNTVFDPIQIKAATKYHSNISINSHLFKIEPDNSGGDDMIELVTYYLPSAIYSHNHHKGFLTYLNIFFVFPAESCGSFYKHLLQGVARTPDKTPQK